MSHARKAPTAVALIPVTLVLARLGAEVISGPDWSPCEASPYDDRKAAAVSKALDAGPRGERLLWGIGE